MSGRLDQSLDSIIDSQKKSKREQQQRRRKPVVKKAPVGGVKKAVKPIRSAVKPAGGAAGHPQASKIVVSGLPYDVNEAQIKEYFGKSVGFVKKVSLQYNQTGQSRGIADIIFAKPGLAAKAAKELNGMLVDKRPMKIEVVVDANSVPEAPAAKSLADRMAANPKAQPKSATSTKATAKNAKGAKAAAARPKRGKSNKAKPKTAEELDAEMTDYWGTNNAATTAAGATATNGAAPAAAGDDLGMDGIS